MGNERARMVEQVADSVLRRSGLLGVCRRIDARESQIVRVLAYHRVNDVRDYPENGDPDNIVGLDSFVEQITLLRRYYQPIRLADLQASFDDGRPLPRNAVLVTFDDGYRDFLTHAWPVLKDRSIPAILFVPTEYPDSGRPFWWDELWQMVLRSTLPTCSLPWAGRLDLRTPHAREEAARRLRRMIKRLHPRLLEQRMAELRDTLGVSSHVALNLGWHELRLLAQDGVVIGSHGRSHGSLPSLTDEEVGREVVGSEEDLERELGSASRVFCFPYGDRDWRTTALLKAKGYIAAFSSSPGHNPVPGVNRFWMFRYSVGPSHSASRVQLMLAGFFPPGLVRLRTMAWLRAK